MAEEPREKSDSTRSASLGLAKDSEIVTSENEKVEESSEVDERAPEAQDRDNEGQGGGITQEDISSSNQDGMLPVIEETNEGDDGASQVPTTSEVGNDSVSNKEIQSEMEMGEVMEGSLEPLEVDESKTAEGISDEAVAIEIGDGSEAHEVPEAHEFPETHEDHEVTEANEVYEVPEVPELEGVAVEVVDESTLPNTMRTEEELISSRELDRAPSVIGDDDDDEEKEPSKHSLLPPESDEIDEEVKSLVPSEGIHGSKESLSSHPSLIEGEEVSDDEVSEKRSDKVSLQRSEMVELCKNLLLERKQLRKKNLLFQKMLHDYFKKKKAEGTYHEGESNYIGPGPAELHYRKKLLVFDDIQTQVLNEKIKIESESKQLIDERNSLQEEALMELDSLLKQEETLGHGLIDSQTGKILSDKVTHQLINRQGQIAKKLSDAMLKYIKIRDRMNEAEAALKSLEDLGEGLHLFDYERLLVEKQSLHDKIDERDSELSRLREKIETSIITMTHMDEKAFGTNQVVHVCRINLHASLSSLREIREERTKAQKRLIHLRNEIERLHHEAGLLAHHPLLHDFESIIEQVDQLELEVNRMKMHVTRGERLSPQDSTHSDGVSKRSVSCVRLKQQTRETGRSASQGSQSAPRLSEQKPSLMRGRPTIVAFLPQHGN